MDVAIRMRTFSTMSLEEDRKLNRQSLQSMPYYFTEGPIFSVDGQQLMLQETVVDRAFLFSGNVEFLPIVSSGNALRPGDIQREIHAFKANQSSGTLCMISSSMDSLPRKKSIRKRILREIAENLPNGGYYALTTSVEVPLEELTRIVGSLMFSCDYFIEGSDKTARVHLFKKGTVSGRRLAG